MEEIEDNAGSIPETIIEDHCNGKQRVHNEKEGVLFAIEVPL